MPHRSARPTREGASSGPSAERAHPSGGQERSGAGRREGLKDTTESIVVAFILAFVFRAFIIEAFVIPTGSMAATLYGKHGTVTCTDCGWEFSFGLADQSQRPLAGDYAVRPGTPIICQNCGHENASPRVNDRTGNAEPGDRILVFKWPYDLAGERLGPHRWDITVFKDPNDGDINFIKRLVGVPNEVLEIIDGDVYTVPVAELSEATMGTLDALRHLKYLHRAEKRRPPRRSEQVPTEGREAMLEELARKLRVCRKAPAAQRSLWTVVYHHDYPPQERRRGQPYWAAPDDETGTWDTSRRRIRCRSRGSETGDLVFAGKPIDDSCAYNANPSAHAEYNPVGDLNLELVLVPQAGDGYLELQLFKSPDTFRAVIMADGRLELYRSVASEPRAFDEALCINRLAPLKPQQPIAVSFRNVDYRVSLEIDGTEVLATTDEQYAPDVQTLRRPERRRASVKMRAGDFDFDLWHVVLWRDVYYISEGLEPVALPGGGTGWGTTGNPVWLREGEYFMLGDNSAASKDSRLWSMPGEHLLARGEGYQLGTVPEDQLIGRAFFVYWPSGHRTELIPFLRWGIIPNVGRMRWIH